MDRSVLDELREITDRSFKERVEEVGRGSFKDYLRNVSIPMEESEDKVDALNRFYRTLGEAPVAIVVYVNREEDPWQWKNNICDASAAIENLILAAWNLGLGSCWMAGPLKKKGQEIQTFLGIPDEKDIVGIIPIGIPAHNPPPPPKVGVETKIKWIGL